MTDPATPEGDTTPAAASEELEQAEPRMADDGWVGLPGATSLSLSAANVAAARAGSTVILVAGNQNSGKTTLLVQLYAQFLKRSFAGYSFAGSETLDAFDERHYPSRLDSGNPYPETEHTTDTDMRFLHLRVADDEGRQHALLMTDLWGELFLDVSNGAPVADRLPIAPRADKTILVIDGEEIVDKTRRETAMRNARLLVGSFAVEGGLDHDAPLLLLLSKADCIQTADQHWYDERVAGLVAFAQSKGFTDITTATVAARPPNGKGIIGLDTVMTWLCQRSEPVASIAPEPIALSRRVFTTGRMASK